MHSLLISAELHYTNVVQHVGNNFTTSGQYFAASQHLTNINCVTDHVVKTVVSVGQTVQVVTNCTTLLDSGSARAQHLDLSRCCDVTKFCPLVVKLLAICTSKLQNCQYDACQQDVQQFNRVRTYTTSTTCWCLVRWWFCHVVVAVMSCCASWSIL